MADATPSFVNQVNQAGSLDALSKTLTVTEITAAFNKATVFQDKTMIRDVVGNKGATFPATGRLNATYHTPGTEITGKKMNHNERTILVDDTLIADFALAEIDEFKSSVDYRSEYTRQAGDALAQAFDGAVARVGVLAARSSSVVTGEPGGSVITAANMRTDSNVLAAGIFSAQQVFDEKSVPNAERFVFVRPAQYWLAAQNKDLINKDWGAMGSYAKGEIELIAGGKLVKTNNLPTTVVTAGGSVSASTAGDFSKTAALVMQRGAVGTVRLLGIKLDDGWDMRRLVHLFVARMIVGHGILRPDCAIELAIP